MALPVPSGFIILSTDPVDSRFSVANAAARKAFASANVYQGLIIYQQDNKKLYKLTNATSPNLDASWIELGSVTSVNGIGPSDNGNVAVSIAATYTGFSSSLDNQFPSLQASSSGDITSSFSGGALWIVTGETNPARTGSNGETYIFASGSVGQWIQVPNYSQGAADARYLVKSTGGQVDGNISLKEGAKLVGTSSWADKATNAGTADNVNGGSQYYIPIWTSNTALGSSTIYQYPTTNNVGINTNASIDPGIKLFVGGTVAISGSTTITGSLIVSGDYLGSSGITGSLFGTASYVSGSVFDSSNPAISASYALTSSNINGGTTNYIARWIGNTSITASSTMFETTSSGLIVSKSNNSETNTALTIIGSGSLTPLFTIIGSQGTLFSITDSLTGSLFSVTNKIGQPIFDVSSDNTVALGDYTASALFTTIKKTVSPGAGINLYFVTKSLYDGIFIDYVARSGSFVRAGNIIATWSGSVNSNNGADFSEISTFGSNTDDLSFSAYTTNDNKLIVSGSSVTSTWSVKAIIRSI